jgi:drug/metabolite transporter (DMT)-like permease
MRRPGPVELMLLAAILLWALNLTMTRYILTHGFRPLAYATVRYGLATVVFAVIAAVAERSLHISRQRLPLVAAAAAAILANQLCFIYAVKTTEASVVAIVLGATPIFAALLGLGLRTESLSRRFWLGAAFSFAGVGLVAAGAGGELSGDLGGILLAIATAATWALYSVAITPLMREYSASRISVLVLGLGWVGLLVAGFRQTTDQDYGSLGWRIWLLLVVATLGPLVLTNVLWFRSLHRIGPSRATLAANLQPFVAAVFAVVLLSERMTVLQGLGGVAIALGILVARRRAPTPAAPAE